MTSTVGACNVVSCSGPVYATHDAGILSVTVPGSPPTPATRQMLAPVAWTGGQPGAFVVLRFNELPRFGGSLSYVERTFSASATTFHAGGWAITSTTT